MALIIIALVFIRNFVLFHLYVCLPHHPESWWLDGLLVIWVFLSYKSRQMNGFFLITLSIILITFPLTRTLLLRSKPIQGRLKLLNKFRKLLLGVLNSLQISPRRIPLSNTSHHLLFMTTSSNYAFPFLKQIHILPKFVILSLANFLICLF